jgi:flagellar biosynthesis protein FlhB
VADEDLENKTEPPSEQRLRRAREEGQVALGHDAPLVAGVLAGAVALAALGGGLQASLLALLRESASQFPRAPFHTLPGLLLRPALVVVAVALSAGLAATAVTLAQTRGGFWPERAAPDVERLFQPGRLTRILSLEAAVDLLLGAAKVAFVSAAVWLSARDELLAVAGLLRAEPSSQLGATFGLLRTTLRPALAAAVALAIAEWALSRHRFMKKMRMTKDEVRREAKEDEGDPLLRGARRRRHRDLSRGQARVEVPRADALVVNPTHVAVAIRYRRDEGKAPRVVAKGKGKLAEYMRGLAHEHGIPIVEDVPLARLLYRKVKVGREIPAQTYKAVAAILAFVYRVTGRSAAQRS